MTCRSASSNGVAPPCLRERPRTKAMTQAWGLSNRDAKEALFLVIN
eukprot:CAMPEP_0175986710 /NCGR_PEP_ID=MMETSP0108-20121206/50293_1 /TAXON_ID=195067 ORGANISM="Goniomonas pacifica, Strain CCMP1869" /NCGR_SAMPLE_ID=MMETSP0108 /ASSEMBLY_ACC=CAM_ASM_000204 /LENGTH=45 /DNA_ID= /DNA_START= /DNA_END= /DNA_ORIENTATION=